MTIVTEFGKSRYNRLPMVMSASDHTFQSKVDKLLGDVEGINTYTNDIFVLINERLSKHM